MTTHIKGKQRALDYTCPVCGIQFGSAVKKTYCSLKCYRSSPQLKAILQANNDKKKTGAVLVCVECGASVYRNSFRINRGEECCSRVCKFSYLAKRFDRYIATPESIALPQGYDEFLSKDELPCLVDGCEWVGAQLSLHMNFIHGVTAEELKLIAGFNKTQGVVAAPLAKKLHERATHEGHNFALDTHEEVVARASGGLGKMRAQGVERIRKMRALRRDQREQV